MSDKAPVAGLRRRDFLKTTVVASAAMFSSASVEVAAGNEIEGLLGGAGRGGLIDTNVTLGQWPCRRLPLDDTEALVAKLRLRGVTQAWAASFDALLHKDMAQVNARLAEECRKKGRGILIPIGCVNPTLPDWEEDLRRCQARFKMPGIRLYPNYHRYKLDDPEFARLLDRATECGLFVQLAVTLEDERTQHPLMQVPHVDVRPLPALLGARPRTRMVLLNWFRGVKGEPLAKLAATTQVLFDIGTVEGVGGVGNLLKQVPAGRVVFGSYAPFFYFESALLKLKESTLTTEQMSAIRADSARACYFAARSSAFKTIPGVNASGNTMGGSALAFG